MEGVGETFRLVQRFNEISDQFAEPMDEAQMNKLLEEQAKLQDAIDASGGWGAPRKLESAPARPPPPPRGPQDEPASGGREPPPARRRLLASRPAHPVPVWPAHL